MLWHALKFDKFIVAGPEIPDNFCPGGHVGPENLGGMLFSELLSRGFIVAIGDEETCLHDYSWVMEERRTIQALYLILTTKCNLQCSYCLYRANNSGSLTGTGQQMSKRVACEAVKLFAKETAKNDRNRPGYWEEVTLYGGEPLINRICLENAVGHIRQLQADGQAWPDIHLVLNTNGTLIDDRFIEFARKEQIEVQISIDGPAHIHDQVRQFRNGKGSFGTVLRGLERMQSVGLEFVPLITITDANINSLADCVGWLCRRFSIKRYGLNLLMHTHGAVDPSYGVRAAEAMQETHTVASSFGAVDKMYEGAFRSFAEKRIAPQSCGAGRKLVVFPDGGIHACQALEASSITRIGYLPVFAPDNRNRVLWSNRNRFSNSECLICPAIGGCGGGCGASAFNAFGNALGIDPNHCAWMKCVFAKWLEEEAVSILT